ncbi:hypothetical protein ACGTN6_11980 [Halomonas sp. THAF12]
MTFLPPIPPLTVRCGLPRAGKTILLDDATRLASHQSAQALPDPFPAWG